MPHIIGWMTRSSGAELGSTSFLEIITGPYMVGEKLTLFLHSFPSGLSLHSTSW